MRNFKALTFVLFKNSFGMLADGKQKKSFSILLYGILLICMLPLAFLAYQLFHLLMEQLSMIQQEGMVLAIGFQISCLITFIFSIFLLPAIFYFSKDLDTLLVLPLRPETILASKFSVCLFYEYAFASFICFPLFIAYGNIFGYSIPFIIFASLIFLTLPIYPLVLSSILIMLLMQFVPFFKNRDRFNLIAGILSVILAFGFSFAINTIQPDMQNIIEMLSEGNNSFISLFSKLFPAIPFACDSLIDKNIIAILIYLAITFGSFIILLCLGKYLHFKGAIGFSETKSSRKKLSEQDLQKLNHKQNKVISYTIKELKLLVKTPVYALNCLMMVVLMPFLLLFTYYTSDMKELISMLPDVSSFFQQHIVYSIPIGLACGFFFSNINLISSTSISREGSNIAFMKFIPMSIKEQLHAKVLSGILLSILSMLLTMLCLYFLLPIIPLNWYLIIFLTSIITIILGNFIGIIIDILHPKLVWEQEASAVKQNFAGPVSMFLGVGIGIGIGYLIYKVPYDYILYLGIGILIVCILLDMVFYMRIDSFTKKQFDEY